MINLQYGGWDIEIDPDYGASILKCSYGSRNVLRPASPKWSTSKDPFEASCFPLVPFSNRIENGEFQFAEERVKLKPNHPKQCHPIHGFGFSSPWDVKVLKPNHIEMSMSYDLGEWPWPFEAFYEITVSNNGLLQKLSIKNVGPNIMPAGLGFHPYFPEQKTAILNFSAKGYWLADNQQLPTHWTKIDENSNFSNSRILNGLSFDNCFTGWNGIAKISWVNKPESLVITGTRSLDHAVLYVPRGHDYFCFEPVSHANNALVSSMVGMNAKQMSVLPGATHQAEMLIKMCA